MSSFAVPKNGGEMTMIQESGSSVDPSFLLESLRCQKFEIDLETSSSNDPVYRIFSEKNSENNFTLSGSELIEDVQYRLQLLDECSPITKSAEKIIALVTKQETADEEMELISKNLLERIQKNSPNLCIPAIEDIQIQGLLREELIKRYFTLGLSPKFNFSKVRIKNKLLQNHLLKNSLLIMVGEMDLLKRIENNEELSESSTLWDKRKTTSHKDRVHHLFPISFQQVLLLKDKPKKWKEYFCSNLYPIFHEQWPEQFKSAEEFVDKYKMKIHFHILDCLVPYLLTLEKHIRKNGHRKSSDQQMNPTYRLVRWLINNNLLDHFGFLLSVEIKSHKVVIDLSGGKRELGETSLECGIRETYEELGFDFSSVSTSFKDEENLVEGIHKEETGLDCVEQKEKGLEDWISLENVDVGDMNCFFFLHDSIGRPFQEVPDVK
jgi:8-oxo-dGTP pyrophosphatase MutT (NUDIX family)